MHMYCMHEFCTVCMNSHYSSKTDTLGVILHNQVYKVATILHSHLYKGTEVNHDTF